MDATDQPRPGPMNPELTQPSLLSRVRDPSDERAWREFELKYRELVLRFCRRQGMQQADAEDVLQIVLANLLRSLPTFLYDPNRGRFRDYLYRSVRNAIIHLASRPKSGHVALDTSMLAAAPAEDESGTDALWDQEWVNHHYRLAMETVRQTFEAKSIDVFERSLRGESVEQLANAFSLSTQAVHKIRQRIRARMEDLIDQQIREEDSVDEPAGSS